MLGILYKALLLKTDLDYNRLDYACLMYIFLHVIGDHVVIGIFDRTLGLYFCELKTMTY